MADFNPNTDLSKGKKFKDEWLWATHIPGRRPEFKVHRHVGHAKNAMNNYSHRWVDRTLWFNNNGTWEKKAEIKADNNSRGYLFEANDKNEVEVTEKPKGYSW